VRLATLLGPELKKLIEESPEQLNELLVDMHPEDLADALADLEPEEVAKVIALVPARAGAPIVQRLADHEQVIVAGLLPVEKLAYVASAMAAGRRAHPTRAGTARHSGTPRPLRARGRSLIASSHLPRLARGGAARDRPLASRLCPFGQPPRIHCLERRTIRRSNSGTLTCVSGLVCAVSRMEDARAAKLTR
jgi:hypothetical protein